MELATDDTQRLIANTVRRLLAEKNNFEARRARLSGADPERLALWPDLVEAGVLGGLFPEAAGGYGGTARDVAVVFYEIGRSLAVEPLAAALACGRVLLAAGQPWHDEISTLIGGERILAFAHGEGFDPISVTAMIAMPLAEVYLLTGIKVAVRHADVADAFVVTARIAEASGEEACFLVERGAPGLAMDAHRRIDASAGATLMRFDGVSARLLLKGDAARRAIVDAVEYGIVAQAAEAVGIMDALNAATRAYLLTRVQFGTPIARFQALQHRAADMFIAGEEAAGTLEFLLGAMAEPADRRSAWVSALKVVVDRTGRRVAHEAAQLHGGMGMSDELIVSHYLRRLAAIRAEFGGEEAHLERVATLAADGLESNEAAAVTSFRQAVREFIRDQVPHDLQRKVTLGLLLEREDYQRWERVLRRQGWFAAAWPQQHGGAGWDLGRQLTFVQEAALNDAPPIIPYGVNMVGPVLYTFGTEEQKAKYLPGILNSETWWCQGYSEPNAGSDLASLKTFAERDGDDYVINGTKMWTTEAHWADMMHCLVRTRRAGKPQEGISFILIDMKTPGLTVRPILTLDGQHHTNQTFFDDVRVPAENVVGGEGQGWTIAKFLLGSERIAIADTGAKLRLLQQVRQMLAQAKQDPTLRAGVAARLAARVTDLGVQLWTLVALERRYVDMWAAGGSRAGPEASLLKIRGTEILQDLTLLAMEIRGPNAAVHDPADLRQNEGSDFGTAEHSSFVGNHYLYARCWSIFGGTNEIQRNIISRTIGVS